MIILAVDFESYYDSSYGIQEYGVFGYLHNEKFNPYLVSVWGNGVQWVGNPRNMPPDIKQKIKDADACAAHNAAFDRQVWDRCVELGIFDFSPKRWFCTANLSVYLGGPRSLKDASKQWLDVSVDKTMRDYMKGKTWEDAVADGKDQLLMQYGLSDSEHCFNLWTKLSPLWPEAERETAEITYIQTKRGVRIDMERLTAGIPKVLEARDAALHEIPWSGEKDAEGEAYKTLSSKALKLWCKKLGVEPPTSTDAKSPEFQDWQEAHKDLKFVKAMQVYRSSNAMALKADTIRRQTNTDGRWNFTMLYFGATTGRWSAGYEDDHNDRGGANIQNLTKEEMYGLNLRHTIVPAKGKKFIISDYSQIEPRCLAWLCGDEVFLDSIRKGTPLYEAHAIASMGWTKGSVPLKKANAKQYALAKARVLALGYGAGWAKFIFMATMYGCQECLWDTVTDTQKQAFIRYVARTKQQDKVKDFTTDKEWTEAVNAWLIVMDFRSSNPKIKDLWERLEADCRGCVGTDYKVELPSGRILPYFNVDWKGGLVVQKTKGDTQQKIWGGFLTENVTQATARDVMRDAIINLEKAGITTLFTVHDEIVCEVDRSFDKEEIRGIMNRCPDWIEGLPLEIEQDETDYYKK